MPPMEGRPIAPRAGPPTIGPRTNPSDLRFLLGYATPYRTALDFVRC